MLLERPVAQVLEPARFAVVVSKARHRDVEIAIPVEIAGPRVRHPRHITYQHAVAESLRAIVVEQDDRPDTSVRGQQDPEARDEQVQIAVAVEVDRLHGDRRGHGGADRTLHVRATRVLVEPENLIPKRIAREDVRQTVSVEVDDADLRDLRPFAVVERADRPGREARRRRPRRKHGVLRGLVGRASGGRAGESGKQNDRRVRVDNEAASHRWAR